MNRIQELREENKISQADLAKYLGVTRQSISLYERGDREPKLETWQKLSDYFGVPVDYIQGRSNDKVGWSLWEEATGYNRATIEFEINELKNANRLNRDDDIQMQIGKAVQFLDNRGKTDYNAVEEARRGISQLMNHIHDDFYIDPNKLDPSTFVGNTRFRNGKTEYDGSLYYEDMDKQVHDAISDILEQARVKLGNYMNEHKFDTRYNHRINTSKVELSEQSIDDTKKGNIPHT